MNAPVLRSTLVTASFGIFFFFLSRGWGKAGIYVFYFKDSLATDFPQGNAKKFAISYWIKHGSFPFVPPPTLPLFLVLIYWLN